MKPANCVNFEDLGKEVADPETDDPSREYKKEFEDYSEQTLSDTPVRDILQELSLKGALDASPEEVERLALALTDGLCEKIVQAKYGAPINRRVINWLRGRIRR
jgi:hypothetical protein